MNDNNNQDLLDCIHDIYQTVIEPLQWQAVLQRLSSYVCNGKGAITARDNKTGYVDVYDLVHTKTFGISEEFVDKYVREAHKIDIWTEIESKKSVGEISVYSQLLSFDQLKNTDFYKLWLTPQNLTDAIAVQLFKTKHFRIVLNILHDDKSTSLTKLINDLEILMPHLTLALTLRMSSEGIDYESKHKGRSNYLMKRFGITERELQVVTAWARLPTIKEVAKSLNISEDTVKSHLKNVRDKIGVSSNHELRLLLFSFTDLAQSS